MAQPAMRNGVKLKRMPAGWKRAVVSKMRSLALLGLAPLLATLARAETIQPCELASRLVNHYNFSKEVVNDWVCIARFESEFNTSAVGSLNSDGSKDVGIFQLSDKFWCQWGASGKACNLKCEDLLDDDISDDLKCAKKVFREHKSLSGNGFNAWVAWKTRCQGDISHFTKDCSFSEEKETDKKTTAVVPGIKAPKRPNVKRKSP